MSGGMVAAVRSRNVAILAAFALLYSILQFNSYTRRSATWDEPMHLTAGYVALTKGDYRVDTTHPPFLRMWSALPLLLMEVREPDTTAIDATTGAAWIEDGYEFARRFLFGQRDADRVLNAARFMVVIVGIVLGMLLFFWAYEWYGLLPAIIALALYTFEPNLLAHAGLVTTDFGATCFIFAAVYALWRVARQPSTGNLAALTASVALALLTKFSGVLLAPIVILLIGLSVRAGQLRTRTAMLIVVVLAATTFVAIWSAYGFRYNPSPDDSWLLTLHDSTLAARTPALSGIVSWIDGYRLLPNAFTQGVLLSQASLDGWPAFLAGEYRLGGWWHYFPLAFLLKTPIALVILFIVGAAILAGQRMRRAFVAVPIVVLLGAAMASSINMGLRHILPIYPFVLLIAAAGAGRIIASRHAFARVAAAIVLTAFIAETAQAYPRPLTFFNVLAGGPENGFRYLADSNLAWGGNLKALKHWMDENGVDHVNFAYFGSGDPAYYGIACTYLPGSPTFAFDFIAKPRLPGYVAISGTVLAGVYLSPPWRAFYRAFWDLEPAAVIGNSTRVYWVDEWPHVSHVDPDTHRSLGDALIMGMKWPEEAVHHYKAYLQVRPDDPAVLTNLGIALAESGRGDESIDVLTRVTLLAPDNPSAKANLQRALSLYGRREAARR
jgi:4-amino-4-deoxy-L-arabinose transferase-like glycosyltransferase